MKKRLFAIVLGLTLGVSLLAGCGQTTTAQNESKSVTEEEAETENSSGDSDLNQATELNVGVSRYSLPAIIASEKGFFEEEFGDEVQYSISFMESGPAIAEAITGGSLDLGHSANMPITQANANNGKLKIFAEYQVNSEPWSLLYVRKDADIHSIEDLKGHTVGYSVGTISHQLLMVMLAAEGISTDEINLVSVSGNTGDLQSALQSGTIEAALLNNVNLDDDDTVEAIISSDGYLDQRNFLFGDSDYAEANPDIIVRYLQVLQRSAEWMKENEDEAIEVLAEYENAEPDDVRILYDQSEFEILWSDEITDYVQDTTSFLYDNGSLDLETPFEDLVDTTYVEKAEFVK